MVEKNDRSKKWINNIPAMIGFITLLLGFTKRLYLQQYYSYFNIDMKYVSISYYWNLSDLITYLFFILIFISSLLCVRFFYYYLDKRSEYVNKIKKDTKVSPMIIKFLKKEIKQYSIAIHIWLAIMVFVVLFVTVVFFRTSDSGYIHKGTFISAFVAASCFTTCILYIAQQAKNKKYVEIIRPDEEYLIAKEIYENFYQEDKKNESYRKYQIEAIAGFYSPAKVKWRKVLLLSILPIILLFICTNSFLGTYDAETQRQFWVTEDNEHIAIPVSEDRYALIDIEEDNGCLTLFLGTQNFHESNDFPCIQKTYNDVKRIFLNQT